MVAKMLAARRGRTGWDWTDWATYLYLVLGVLLMFGPVLWLFLSSVKTQAGLDMFPPTFLPWEQKQLSLPGKPTMPMFQVTAGDHAGQSLAQVRRIGLQAIPADIYEAAAMDAAPPWRTFWRLTLPLLMPSLAVVFILGMIRAVQIFDEVYVLTGGGPGTATVYLVQFIYQTGFAAGVRQYGLAAAGSLLLAAVLLVFTLVQLRGMRRSAGS